VSVDSLVTQLRAALRARHGTSFTSRNIALLFHEMDADHNGAGPLLR
jgi:hypothetical protein